MKSNIRSGLFVAAAVALCMGPLWADEFADIISEADGAVQQSQTLIQQGQSQVQSFDQTGQIPSSQQASSSGYNYDGDGESSGQTSASDGVIYDSGKDKFANAKTKFILEAKDNKNEYDTGVHYSEYKINDGPFTKYEGGFNITVPGEHFIYYRSIDKAGNIEATQNYRIIIDNKAPDVFILPNKDLYNKGGTKYAGPEHQFVIKAQDDSSGVGKLQYRINNGSWTDYSGPIKMSQSGPTKLEAVAFDNVLNRSKVYALNFNVDLVAPSVVIKTNPPPKVINGKTYVTKQTQFIIDAEDSQSGVKAVYYSVDNQKWIQYTGPITFTQEKKVTELKAKAVDNVGNDGEASTGGDGPGTASAGQKVTKMTFEVDKSPPQTSLTAVAGTSTSGSSASASSDDDDSGAVSGPSGDEAASSDGGGDFDDLD